MLASCTLKCFAIFIVSFTTSITFNAILCHFTRRINISSRGIRINNNSYSILSILIYSSFVGLSPNVSRRLGPIVVITRSCSFPSSVERLMRWAVGSSVIIIIITYVFIINIRSHAYSIFYCCRYPSHHHFYTFLKFSGFLLYEPLH